MIKKIISGGQTGADRAALDVALKFDIPHGGWIPKGRKTEKGPLPEKYQLHVMPTDSYPARTEQNVIDSDGTLIVVRGKLIGGTDYTRQMTLKHKKQLLGIDLNLTGHFDAASLKRERLGRNPSTGEDMMLAPRRVVTFKCSGVMKKKINGEKYGLRLYFL